MNLFIRINLFIVLLFLLLMLIWGLTYLIYYFCSKTLSLDEIFDKICGFFICGFFVSGAVLMFSGVVLALIKLIIGGAL